VLSSLAPRKALVACKIEDAIKETNDVRRETPERYDFGDHTRMQVFTLKKQV
jgi:hypothetical protein